MCYRTAVILQVYATYEYGYKNKLTIFQATFGHGLHSITSASAVHCFTKQVAQSVCSVFMPLLVSVHLNCECVPILAN